MKIINRLSIILLLFLGVSQYVSADYPIASHRYLADPGALVYNGRVYLYCSNDDDNPSGERSSYEMHSIVCISSSDMKNWTDHGVVFQVPQDASWAPKSWAPSPATRDGKVFLYFGNGGNGIGVAMANNPLGPFKDPIGKALVSSSTPGVMPARNMWLFDPMTFIDDDGQAYMYFGGNGDDNVRVIKLNKDMISVDGPAIQLTAKNFFEASWMHKNNGIYYFSYSSNPRAEMRIDYMKSDNPISGFTYGGIVSKQPPMNDNNNHQAIFRFNDVWYQAYHNRIVAKQAHVPPVYKRNICLDTFRHNADGTIEIMTNTVDGVKQVGYLNPYQRTEAETFNAQSGIKTEVCVNGGMNLCNIENGDWIKIKGVDFGKTGTKSFSACVAGNGGTIEIILDNPANKPIATCKVTNSEIQKWHTEIYKISKITGVHDVFLKFTGKGANLFNFDWWKFS
ncbi:MAG: family 43 glycosylhydrolase [Bacteroidetes bacterium]|nr:family 43 glycosylhydrolase [Bacteroidota bacterium]